ncbi:MAG TPA: hypothetical protein VFQ43_20895, partial [Nitrososphaera sp.]|nr:hypothetical protein [Nitrososphaera sp.]
MVTEQAWKTTAVKCKIKDNGLQRALASYEKLGEHQHDDRLKAVSSIGQLAGTLKKAKEVTAAPDVLKYLTQLVAALELEEREIVKAKLLADKNEAMTARKAEADAKKRKEEEDQEDEEEAEEEEEEGLGVYPVRLMAAFQKLKGAKDLAFEFIVCDAKPHCGLMVAKRITPKHKEELSKLTDCKRFLPVGTCQFESGRFVFKLENAVSGLARKLQDSIKNFTGKKLPILVGTESVDDGEESGALHPHAGSTARPKEGAAAPKPMRPTLEKAPDVWHQTRKVIETKVAQLKTAIQKAFADEGPDLVAEIDKNMKKLDWILDTLDHKLADSLAKAHAAENPAARQAELK